MRRYSLLETKEERQWIVEERGKKIRGPLGFAKYHCIPIFTGTNYITLTVRIKY